MRLSGERREREQSLMKFVNVRINRYEARSVKCMQKRVDVICEKLKLASDRVNNGIGR